MAEKKGPQGPTSLIYILRISSPKVPDINLLTIAVLQKSFSPHPPLDFCFSLEVRARFGARTGDAWSSFEPTPYEVLEPMLFAYNAAQREEKYVIILVEATRRAIKEQ